MATGGARIDYFDGLRASLMLLGIPFHSALAFSGSTWLVTSPSSSPTIAAFGEFLHVWRMPAFFIVAGFFAAMMVARQGPTTWVRGRFKRLGVPLLAGMIVLSPIQWGIVEWGKTGGWPGAPEFWAARFSTPSAWWTMHLWFLVELLAYCVVVAALVASPARGPLRRATDAFGTWARTRPAAASTVVLGAASVFVVVGLAAWQTIDGDQLFLGLLTRNAIIFLPAFTLGVLLGTNRDNLDSLLRVPVARTALVGGVCVVIVVAIEVVFQVDSPTALAAQAIAWTVGGLTLGALAFRVAAKFFGTPRTAVRWLVDASLPIYLIHQPLVLLFAVLCVSGGVAGWAGWVVTVAATIAGSVVFYELVNAAPWARFLATGSMRRGLSCFDVLSPRASSSHQRA